MGCSWDKMYLLMGYDGPIHIGKSIRFIFIFWILHGYVSKTYPTCIGIGYISRYPIRYGLKYPSFVAITWQHCGDVWVQMFDNLFRGRGAA
jgi:hypothetical protein